MARQIDSSNEMPLLVPSRVGVAKVAEMEKIRIGPSWMPCANNPLAGWRRSISDVSYASDRQCKSDPRYHHVHKTQKSVHDNYDMYEFQTNLYMTSLFS